MVKTLSLGSIDVEVTLKDIKNVHLSVHPPNGRVRISAPSRMSLENIRLYAINKLSWIRQQQAKIRAQARETPREYLERESHYVWGRRYLLKLIEHDDKPSIELKSSKLILRLRPNTDESKRQAIVEAWYREQLKLAALPLIKRWERRLKVTVDNLRVQRMRTRWGSCTPRTSTIRLNTDLAKKPPECLEYIVVHELLHLIEPTHNQRFIALLDRNYPPWPHTRDILNRLPLRHADWEY